jgi:hypothetical protein
MPGNRTKLTSQSVFQSVADRDGMLQSGMEMGVNDSYDRLDELFGDVEKGCEVSAGVSSTKARVLVGFIRLRKASGPDLQSN